MRTILHVDMDAFFAAIELRRHPELKGLPVVVGGRGDPMQRGVVSTATYEARKFGVFSGMPLRTAYHHCPEAVFLPVDYQYYVKISKEIKTILRSFSTIMEDIGLDEAFLDVSDMPEPPTQLALSIKSRIKEATGLTCSVGIGPNKLLAKIASDLEKPDGLTQLTMDDIPRRVWPLPVQTIWGIGPKSAARLAKTGVTTIGELAALSQETLIELFGHAHGDHLYRAARGIDDSPVVTHRKRKSIGHETTFQHDVTDRNVLVHALDELVSESVERLSQGHHKARTITVKIRFADFETRTRSLTLPEATDQRATIDYAVNQCLGRFTLTKPVRLVGIRLSHLEGKGHR
jgi:DNA polymerase-4